jgi:hypothetical protein
MLPGESATISTLGEWSGTDDRRADDVQINREMREVERWNDPAAGFMTTVRYRSVSPPSVSSCYEPLHS